MITVKGNNVLTINVKAGDIVAIEYDKIAVANIVNYTDGSIFVSENNDFKLENNVGKYLTITDGNSYNEYVFYKSGKNTVYIKNDADGYICVVRKIW